MLEPPPADEVDLLALTRASAANGVHLVVATDLASLAAGALLCKGLGRAHVPIAALGVLGPGQRADGPGARAWLAQAHAIILVGARAPLPADDERPCLRLDPAAGEPMAALAYRLAERLAPMADCAWLAAIGLPWLSSESTSHPLIERALQRHSRADLLELQSLLEAASRGPEPGATALFAVEQLTAALDPHRLRTGPAGQLLERNAAAVRSEATRAAHLRPRAGHAVLVVEYESPCRVEELVAERWRRLRPGVAVIAANHGAARGRVAIAARAATDEALAPLRALLDEDDAALLAPETWRALLARLGVPPAPIDRLGAAVEPSALPN